MRTAVVLLSVLSVTLAACGDTVSLDPVAKAAEKTRSVSSARFTLDANVAESGDRLAFTATGAIVDHGDTMLMDMHAPAQGGDDAFNAQLVIPSDEHRVYMRSNAFGKLPDGKQWVSMKDDDPSVNLGQNDPTQILEYLRAVGTVRKVGTDANGTHYHATIDLAKLEQKLPADKRGAFNPAFETLKRAGTGSIPLEVWVGADGYVHRLTMDWNVKNPNNARDTADIHLKMRLSDFGVHVNVPHPTPANSIPLTKLLQHIMQGG